MSPAQPPRAALRELARRRGVATSYRDGLGRRRAVSSDSLVAILRSLGAPVRRPDEAATAIRAWQLQRWNGHTEPVVVAWEGRAPRISLRLPASFDAERLDGRILLETGKGRKLSWDLGEIPASGRATIAGRAFVQKDLPLRGPFPFGYHRVTLRWGSARRKVLVISAPRRSFPPPSGERRWGVFLPLYALHSRESWGTGDLADLRRLAVWTADMGSGILASLPLLASFLDRPCEPSPYRPASRLFWNELYVDVPGAIRMVDGDPARTIPPDLRDAIVAVRRPPLIDYPNAMRLKRRALENLLQQLLEDGDRSLREFRAFLRQHPETVAYARFRAERERRSGGADDQAEIAHRGGQRSSPRSRDYHAFAQWILERQMAETSAALQARRSFLYLDLPLGVHPEGFDVSRYPDSFVDGMSVGAPPDVLFTSGQEWGFPPLHPERTRLREHDYFRAVLRHHMRYASMLRIDHVMALHRLFWVPRGRSADHGTYVQYPADELYAILCLESHRNRSIVVGENLGTVPASVNASLRRHGISTLYVLHYDLEGGGSSSAGRIPAEAVASLNSHDLPPFAAFFRGMDIDEREACGLVSRDQAEAMKRKRAGIRQALQQRLRAEAGAHGNLDEPAVLRGLLDSLARSGAWALLVNLEDAWSETDSQNVPGTSRQMPNWRRKSRRSFEEFASDASVKDLLGEMDRSRRSTRLTPASKQRLANGEST